MVLQKYVFPVRSPSEFPCDIGIPYGTVHLMESPIGQSWDVSRDTIPSKFPWDIMGSTMRNSAIP